MSEPSPCLSCGACCAHFRVSFYAGECQSVGGLVPDELVVPISPHLVAMRGTELKPVRCVALEGEVGCQVSCRVYESRSSTCREFSTSWEDGEHNPHCDAARAAYGLPPVLPRGAPLCA